MRLARRGGLVQRPRSPSGARCSRSPSAATCRGTDPEELAEALDRLLDQEWWPHGYDGIGRRPGPPEGRHQPAHRPVLPGRRGRHPRGVRHRAGSPGTRAELVVPREAAAGVRGPQGGRRPVRHAARRAGAAPRRPAHRHRRTGRGAHRPRPRRPRPAVPRAVRRTRGRRPGAQAGRSSTRSPPSPTPRPAPCTPASRRTPMTRDRDTRRADGDRVTAASPRLRARHGRPTPRFAR